MSDKAIEDAKRGIIAGKPIKEWVDAPYGAFAKAVRETGVDPKFGLDDPLEGLPLKKYSVTISYRYSGRGEKTYTVEARDKKEADDLAGNLFDDDDLDLDEAEVDEARTQNIDEVN
jgi:hypothetical protein